MHYRIKNDKFVISFSYGRYITGVGGTDKAVWDQQHLLNASGISYVFFYPIAGINKLLKFHNGNMWGIIIDGEDQGLINTKEIIYLLHVFQKKNINFCGIIIHHLNNIAIKEFETILDATEGRIFWFLHDYMTICPWGGLIDSSDNYCGSSFPCDEKCSGCKKYVKGLQVACRQLVYKYANRTMFIAPSEAAKAEWGKSYKDLGELVHVIEHKIPTGRYIGNQELLGDDETIRIAFVGYSRNLKGWDYWKNAAVAAYKARKNESFFQFGTTREHFDHVKEIFVDFKKSETSMTDALRKEKIHCAVLWSVWPETFSYTYYEAWASNCFILTNRESGNIAVQVEKNGNGFVAESPSELTNLLGSETHLREMINTYRSNRKVAPDRLIDNEEIKFLVVAQRCKVHTEARIKIFRRLLHKLWNISYYLDRKRRQQKSRGQNS